jgi:hypothetical protein
MARAISQSAHLMHHPLADSVAANTDEASAYVPCLLLVGVDVAPADEPSASFVCAACSAYAIELLKVLRVDLVVVRSPNDDADDADRLTRQIFRPTGPAFCVSTFVKQMHRIAPRQPWALVAGSQLSSQDEIEVRSLGAVAIVDDVSEHICEDGCKEDCKEDCKEVCAKISEQINPSMLPDRMLFNRLLNHRIIGPEALQVVRSIAGLIAQSTVQSTVQSAELSKQLSIVRSSAAFSQQRRVGHSVGPASAVTGSSAADNTNQVTCLNHVEGFEKGEK